MNNQVKVILLIFLMFLFGETHSQQKAHVKGTISYFFNENYGDKPDVSSDVWFVPDSLASASDVSMILNVCAADYDMGWVKSKRKSIKTKSRLIERAMQRYEAETDRDMKKIIRSSIEKDLLQLHEDSNDLKLIENRFTKTHNSDFDKFTAENDSLSYIKLNELKSKSITMGLASDGNGAYDINIPEGKYLVIIKSSHSKGSGSLICIDGKLDINRRLVKSDSENFISTKFK